MTPSDYSAHYAPRSLLYVPGSNARALEKAGGLAVDMLIIDLEDAVPEGRKAEARAAMRAAVAAGFPGKRVAVRVNATGSAEQADDIAARSEEHTSELQSLMRNSYAVFCLKTKNDIT